jgi:hypothetical protein
MEAVLELNQKAKPVHPMYSFECGTWLKIRVNGPEGPTVDYGMLCAMPGEQTYTIVSLHNGYFWFDSAHMKNIKKDPETGEIAFNLDKRWFVEPMTEKVLP